MSEGSPPNRFALTAANRIDFERCLFSGQVFRWVRHGDGSYEGVDAGTWFRISAGFVETNGSVADFERLFNLGVDESAVEAEIVRLAPEMAPYVGGLNGLRILQPNDPTEVFFSFMCSANNHLKRIMPMVARLAEYGTTISGTSLPRFPDVETIAAISEGELRGQGFGYRGATIPAAAREILFRGGDGWLASLASVGYREAHREFVSIKGIGNKLADCICLYGLHYGEAVPIDTHMWQAACRVFFPAHADKALTERRYHEIGDFFRDRFGSLAGWAHLYLYYGNMVGIGRGR